MTGYDRLVKNFCDVIAEEQAKLGFRKETIRLYYPLTSLNHIFKSQDTAEAMQARLEGMPSELKSLFGSLDISHRGERFCFFFGEEGSVYVYNTMGAQPFLKALIGLVGTHGATLDDVTALFKRYDAEAVVSAMDGEEFDRLIRFSDAVDDDYYYCFKDEGCHLIYHRFMPEDYEDFGL